MWAVVGILGDCDETSKTSQSVNLIWTHTTSFAMAKEEHRTIGLQIAKLVKDAYDKDYGNNVASIELDQLHGVEMPYEWMLIL